MELGSSFRSYSRLLVQCANHKELLKGRIIHAQILKSGLQSQTSLRNTLVTMYSKCGSLFEARLEFEGIWKKDVVSWNCIINAYSQHGEELGAFELFQRMRRENVVPDHFTFAGVITAATSNRSYFIVGKQVHSVSIKAANCFDVMVATPLVNMYCKSGCVSDARQLFDKMPYRNCFSWAAMLSGYSFERSGFQALELFKLMMQEKEACGDEFVLSSVISSLTVPEFVENGKQIHGFMIKTGSESYVSVVSSLVTMYAKFGCLNDALQVFELSVSKNSVTWAAMLTGFAWNGNFDEALRLFSKMQFTGLRPCEFGLASVLNSCSNLIALSQGKQVHDYLLKLGFESNIFVKSALVDMYVKCGSVNDARKEFNQLQKPDVVLWTSMIAGCVQNGKSEEALRLYGRMEMERILPDELAMASVLRACSSLSTLEQGRQFHARTIKYGLGLENCIGSALTTMYSKCGSVEDGNFIFRRMHVTDVASWNSMISGFSQNRHYNKALQLFEEMQLEGVKPDHVTYVNVLSACSHMGMVDRGFYYFNLMHQNHGIIPGLEHYTCMVDILSRAGLLAKARDFIESVPIDHGTCLWRILLGACQKYGDYDIGAFVGERLMELGSKLSSVYVLLTHIYLAMGSWGDVERVRSIMKCRGVKKKPGCSWIELNNRVHVFRVREQLHPEIQEIHVVLRRLTKQMRDGGYEPDLLLT